MNYDRYQKYELWLITVIDGLNGNINMPKDPHPTKYLNFTANDCLKSYCRPLKLLVDKQNIWIL